MKVKFRIVITLFKSGIELSKDFDKYTDAKKAFRLHQKKLDADEIKYEITLFKYTE